MVNTGFEFFAFQSFLFGLIIIYVLYIARRIFSYIKMECLKVETNIDKKDAATANTESAGELWDHIERRRGEDRRQIAYLQGRDRRYKKDRRKVN